MVQQPACNFWGLQTKLKTNTSWWIRKPPHIKPRYHYPTKTSKQIHLEHSSRFIPFSVKCGAHMLYTDWCRSRNENLLGTNSKDHLPSKQIPAFNFISDQLQTAASIQSQFVFACVKCKHLNIVTNTTLWCKQTLTLFLKLDQKKLFVFFWLCNMSWDIWILEEKW